MLLNALLYLPARVIAQTPAQAGLRHRDLTLQTTDGERLDGWWIEARSDPIGHVLFFHGNGGNIGDRVANAALLADVGLDVLLFDYRGYGRSTGRPGEHGTYRDARAALATLLEQPGVDPSRVIYLGESLGGGPAVELALARPPAGLVLVSAFTTVREIARLHYPFIPAAVVPDAYPNLRRIAGLRCPLLVIHGEDDMIVPVEHGRRLYEAAPEPKRLRTHPGAGHNDIVTLAGSVLAGEIGEWARTLPALLARGGHGD